MSSGDYWANLLGPTRQGGRIAPPSIREHIAAGLTGPTARVAAEAAEAAAPLLRRAWMAKSDSDRQSGIAEKTQTDAGMDRLVQQHLVTAKQQH